MTRLRKITFFIFVIIYLAVVPLVILNALGIVKQKHDTSFQKTGLIYISTIPSGAVVYIDKKRFTEKTPTIIRSLDPGIYSIKLLFKNYHPWQKRLVVKKEIATTAENVFLVPIRWKNHALSDDSYENLIPIPQYPAILLTKGKFLKDVFSYQWPEDIRKSVFNMEDLLISPKIKTLFPETSMYLEEEWEKIDIQEKSSRCLLIVKGKNQKRYIWSPLNSSETAEDITKLLSPSSSRLFWSTENHSLLYETVNKEINLIDLNARAVFPQIIKDVTSFDILDGRIYAMHNDNVIKRYNLKGEFEKNLLSDPQLIQNLFQNQKSFRLDALTPEIFIFLSAKGTLLSNLLPYIIYESGIKGYLYNERKSRLLIWRENDVGIVNFSKTGLNTLFEYGPSIKWLNLMGKDITQAYWANDGSHTIYVDNSQVFITPVEDFNQAEKYLITPVKRNTSITYSDKVGVLFYLDHAHGQLSFIKIRSEIELLPDNLQP